MALHLLVACMQVGGVQNGLLVGSCYGCGCSVAVVPGRRGTIARKMYTKLQLARAFPRLAAYLEVAWYLEGPPSPSCLPGGCMVS